MVMPNSRERFEAEFTRTWPEYVRLTPDVFNRVGDGAYVDGTIHVAFVMWQAGAAAEREACAKICESFGGELTKWPDAYEGATAETQFIRGIGDCISKPFAKAIRDRSAP